MYALTPCNQVVELAALSEDKDNAQILQEVVGMVNCLQMFPFSPAEYDSTHSTLLRSAYINTFVYVPIQSGTVECLLYMLNSPNIYLSTSALVVLSNISKLPDSWKVRSCLRYDTLRGCCLIVSGFCCQIDMCVYVC